MIEEEYEDQCAWVYIILGLTYFPKEWKSSTSNFCGNKFFFFKAWLRENSSEKKTWISSFHITKAYSSEFWVMQTDN